MTTTVVTVTVATPHTCEVRGQPALRLLKKAGVPKLYAHATLSGGPACWTFPALRLGDVLAAAEVSRGVRVELVRAQDALPFADTPIDRIASAS